MGKMKVTGIVLMLIVTGLIPMIMQAGTASAAEVSGNQSGTWNSAGSPYYITGSVTVPAGQSLEIDTTGGPVDVIFNGSFSLFVSGDFYVNGSSANPVTFKSNKTTPAPADWGTIHVFSTGHCEVSYANVWYGTYGILLDGSSNNTVSNCNISSNLYYGIYLRPLLASFPRDNYIANNIFSNCVDGIYLSESNTTTLVNNTAMNTTTGGFVMFGCHNSTVSNNTAYDNYYGILFSYSTHNNIDNNTMYDNVHGLFLRSISTNNTLANNTAYDNELGIHIKNSANNTIINNNASYNMDAGIIIAISSNNTVADNTLSFNKIGIHLSYSSIISATGNTMLENGVLIEDGDLEHWNTHTIDVFNTVNGKPLYYWKNQTGGTIPAGAGQVILANCSDIVIQGQILNNATVGIEAGFSSNITMVNNTVSFNIWSGIYVYLTQEITLVNTTMLKDSIFIFGDLIEHWNTHTIDTSNTVNGKPVYYWKDRITGTLPPGAGEIILANCDNVVVNRQYIGDGTVGILIGFSDANKIINNELDANSMYGICLIYSSNNQIYYNKFINNSVQAFSIGVNSWDYGADGGNYWNDFDEDIEGAYDEFRGALQNSIGSDGLVDLGFPVGGINPYYVPGSVGNKDSYPFRNIICFPIRINSNSEFDRGHGVSEGSGTLSDPWIIESGHIDGSGYGYCIYIGNTTDHFVVRNYNLHHADGVGSGPYYPDTGLVLYNVENGRLDNNTITNSDGGILLYQSSRVNVSKNTMVDNGIYVVGENLDEWNSHSMDELNTVNGKPLYYLKNQTSGLIPPGAGEVIVANCTNIVVENQNVSDGSAGILIGFSSDCVIANNTANSNFYTGIELYESTDNEVINNTADENFKGISLDYNADFNNVTGNNVSGNEWGIYLDAADNNIISENTAIYNNNGIVLSLSRTNDVIFNDASDNGYGIWLDFSSNRNMVTDNNASGNVYGIALSFASNYNSISDNNVSDNDNGIHFYSSGNNYVGNNTCMGNLFQGIKADISTENTIVNNTCRLNDDSGLYLVNSNFNTVINNNFSDSVNYHGIDIEDSMYNLIDNNTCSNNHQQGIYLHYSSLNDVKDNICQTNGDSGIYLAQSIENTIENNLCTDSLGGNGINVDFSSDNNILANNTCRDNYFYGIRLWDSDLNTVSNNTCQHNIEHGMYFWSSSNNIVDNNLCTDNVKDGIYLDFSSNDNTIVNNTCIGNDVGINLSPSTRNDIIENSLTENFYGIYLCFSGLNYFFDNTIASNQYGIYFESSDNNFVESCNISYGYTGILMDGSDNNYIFDSNIHTNIVGINVVASSSNIFEESLIGHNKGAGEPYYSFETGLDVYQDDDDLANYTDFDDQLANGNGSNPFFTRAINVDRGLSMSVHIWGHANSPDLDLAIFFDGLAGNPEDGITQAGELIAYDADWNADEQVTLSTIQDGTYLIRVFGYSVTGDPAGQFDMEISLDVARSDGILFMGSSSNYVLNCTIINNTNGINLTGSTGHFIYHNRFINNENQSYDNSPGSNFWDDGYPSGGNYWSDYPGNDIYSGPAQDILGSDGIGDTPYDIGGGFGNQDYYPLYIDPYAPISSVDAIFPYWYGTQPLVLTASAVGIDTVVENVTLWYRFSPDNMTWGVWLLYGTDSSSPWSWSFNFNEGDGFYEFTSTAIDWENTHEALRNIGDTSCAYDTTPPSSNALSLPTYTTLSAFDVDFTGTDSGCGFYSASLYYRYNSGPWTLYTTPANPSGQWTSSPISFGNVTDDGIYDFYTLGTDNLGHVEAPPIGKDATTIVDRYAPISSVNALPTVTASTDFFVTYNATDNGSGIKSVQLFYNFDGGPWMSYGNYLSSPVIFLAVDGDGLYEFYCQATDNLNNIEAKAATMEANITLDTGSPTGLSMVIDGGATYTTDLSVDLELLAIDGTEMSFSNDGIIWSTWEPYGTTKTGWLLMDGDGTKIVYFKCRDSAGNEALTSDSIILDTMDPVAVSVDIDDGAAYAISTSVTLSIYASDANGIYQMMLSNDGVFDSETWEAYATTKAWVLSNGDGIKTVYVLFRDDALLESDVISDTIILDTIDPTGSIMINNGEEYVSSPISVLMLSAYDTNGITMMRISIDGTFDTEIWESFMTSKAWMLSGADGLKEVFVQYMDGAGRVSGTYGSNITLDTTSPVTTASISGLEGNGGWFVGNVTITLTGSDTTSGLNQTYYRINSGPWVSGDSVALDSDGTHTIEYYSVDNAANSEVINFMTVSVDTTAPTVFSTTPVDGSTGVVAGRVIMIEFNEPMNTTTVEASVSLSPVTTISSYTWNNDNTVLRMVLFSDFEENTTYTITIGADAEDAAGNTMASDYTGSFTTWIEEVIDVPEDTTAPTVFSTTPVDGSTGVVAGRVIMIEFNEPMNTTTVEASVSLSPVTTISSYTWNNDNTVLRMVLFSDFEENTTYTITISSGAEDIAGNAMASDYTGSFTTWVEEVIDVLDPGDEDEPDNWWLIHLIFLIIILFVLLAGRRRKKEEPETTPEARTAAVAGAAKAVPPPPEESKDELEFEECPTCGYDMEKGEECPICAGEDGMDEEDEDEYEEDEDEEVDENIPHSEELGWKYKKDGVVDDDDEVYEMGTVMEK